MIKIQDNQLEQLNGGADCGTINGFGTGLMVGFAVFGGAIGGPVGAFLGVELGAAAALAISGSNGCIGEGY